MITKRRLGALLALVAMGLLAIVPMVADGGPKRSLDISLGAAFATADGFGGVGTAPSAHVALFYYISADSAIGVHLVRWNYHLGANPGLMTFGYGFSIRHWWPSDWPKLDPFKPFIGYGIFLNQAFQLSPESQRSTKLFADGRGIAHDTRLTWGTDIALADRFALTVEGDFDLSSYPYFALPSTNTPALNFLSAYLGCRILW